MKNTLEKYLTEKVKKDKKWKDHVGEVSEMCKWEYNNIMEFFGDILTNCNFHTEKKYIMRYMADKKW